MNNPYFAQPYQQPYQQPYSRQQYPWTQQQQNYAQPQTDEKIYVQGADAAKAYLVGANSSVRLWDSTQPVFYEKWADATGRPSLIAYRYEAVDLAEKASVPFDSINNYEKRLNAIESRLNQLERGSVNEQSDANN